MQKLMRHSIKSTQKDISNKKMVTKKKKKHFKHLNFIPQKLEKEKQTPKLVKERK